ncbi:MAG: site-specific integrase [Lachnospiraceae bacterium]|nr:site-specific integrase [Lachnospiraceae bacterium]
MKKLSLKNSDNLTAFENTGKYHEGISQIPKGRSGGLCICNTYGNKGDICTYQNMLAAYNRSKGVGKTSAHLYRHTFAKKSILNGGDIFRLQKILRHSDLSVVKEYVQMYIEHPCLVLNGSQGSGKTTMSTFIETLIDPVAVLLLISKPEEIYDEEKI